MRHVIAYIYIYMLPVACLSEFMDCRLQDRCTCFSCLRDNRTGRNSNEGVSKEGRKAVEGLAGCLDARRSTLARLCLARCRHPLLARRDLQFEADVLLQEQPPN